MPGDSGWIADITTRILIGPAERKPSCKFMSGQYFYCMLGFNVKQPTRTNTCIFNRKRDDIRNYKQKQSNGGNKNEEWGKEINLQTIKTHILHFQQMNNGECNMRIASFISTGLDLLIVFLDTLRSHSINDGIASGIQRANEDRNGNQGSYQKDG